MDEKVWQDYKRHCGLPLSLTKYILTEKRLFRRTGFFVRKEDQISLYHIRDLEVSISLFQRLFGVGTVRVIGVDKTTPELRLENIRKPYQIRDLLQSHIETECLRRNMRYAEHIESNDFSDDDDD